MHCTTVFKKVLNVFVPPNQIGNLDRTRTNALASSSSFQDGAQEKDVLGRVQPKVHVISSTIVGEHHSYLKPHEMTPVESRLSILGHTSSNHYKSDSDMMTSELDDDGSEEDAEPSSVTNPIVFSEDPITCSNEMVELANDLVDVALTNIAESEEIMDAFHIEDLSWWKKRLDWTSEMMEILETDTPAVRLLKARTYLTAAGALLKRVILVVEHAKSLNDVQLGNSESTEQHEA